MGGMYQAQRAQVRVAQNAFSYGKMDKSKPYQDRRGDPQNCAPGDVGTKGTASAVPHDLAKLIGLRWDETAGLAEEISFPKRTQGAKGDQPLGRLARSSVV
jgi:hypothetical protein